jgi:DNA-binding NarL/FixJ family response regulator
MLRFLIVDDHPLVRGELREAVRHHFTNIEVGEASTVDLSHASVRPAEWDLIIMDTTMFGKTGPQTFQDLKQACPAVPVLVLTTAHTPDTAEPTRRTTDELVRAVKKLLSIRLGQGPFLSRAAMEQRHRELSEREYEVLCLIASGLRLNEIANKLALSANTVSTYRSRILEKMKMRTNAELTNYAFRQSLVR